MGLATSKLSVIEPERLHWNIHVSVFRSTGGTFLNRTSVSAAFYYWLRLTAAVSSRAADLKVLQHLFWIIQRFVAVCIHLRQGGASKRAAARRGLLLKIIILPLLSWQTLKKEITEKTGQGENWGKPADLLLHRMWIPWEGGKRKDGKALHDFLSFCLHTSPSACINSLPSEE